ncbi:MAG: Mfa1 fimbrilin C-terminal domain-containing protein [Muribaculaceae bacterium]|nr:Mfa1 fimbrilin C-terminal domain-containing protein [Muribaculaceae bacterium]
MIATEAALNSTDENIKELAHIINNVEVDGKKPLTGDLSLDPILYKFKSIKNNVGGIYATWENVQKAAKDAAITPVWESDNTPAGGFWRLDINRSTPIFQAVFGSPAKDGEPAKTGSCGSYTFKDSKGEEYTIDDPLQITDADGKKQPAWNVDSPNYRWMQWADAGKPIPGSTTTDAANAKLYTDFKAAAVAANITLYQTSYDGNDEYGYYCYYYYWNRHNDNGLNGIMGPMEFAVVRNNVYKLAVLDIKDLGHPRFSENDPKKPTPNTDDEIDDVYITVDVNVLPWVVRVNDIHF